MNKYWTIFTEDYLSHWIVARFKPDGNGMQRAREFAKNY